jgi:hypothetical protein
VGSAPRVITTWADTTFIPLVIVGQQQRRPLAADDRVHALAVGVRPRFGVITDVSNGAPP